jgi:hypothetical protein
LRPSLRIFNCLLISNEEADPRVSFEVTPRSAGPSLTPTFAGCKNRSSLQSHHSSTANGLLDGFDYISYCHLNASKLTKKCIEQSERETGSSWPQKQAYMDS